MKLAVFAHKECWRSASSPTGYATDGGFPFHMYALSELFDETVVVVPVSEHGAAAGEGALRGRNLRIAPLTSLRGYRRCGKIGVAPWLARNLPALWRQARAADAIHAPIPGDVGTFGMLLALLLRKPLFVRHCGNWHRPRTAAEHLWKRWMEKLAGGRNVMLATGGGIEPPSPHNPQVRWIFSSSLTAAQLAAVARERRDFGNEPAPRLVIACRQQRLKGTGLLIDSLPLILRDFPPATLDVLGDGEELPEFRRLAERLRLADRVIFHGKVEHGRVLEVMQRSALFCYPTTASEGFPKVVLEAMACGLPVITTRVSILPQLIGSGCGVLLDDTRPETIANAVRHCLADRDRYQALSRKAQETAGQFSLERWRDTIGGWLEAAWGPLHA